MLSKIRVWNSTFSTPRFLIGGEQRAMTVESNQCKLRRMCCSFCCRRDLEEQGLPTETATLKQKLKPSSKTWPHEAPNLLSPRVMESGSLSLRGWWMSHVKWEVTEMKRKSKPNVRQASQS